MRNLLLAALLAVTTASWAQAPSAPLYDALGGQAGLARLMDDFMQRIETDARLAPHFKDANKQRVKEQLVDQVCQLSGGPCVYKGADMKSAHANLDIRKSDFNALVEVLQQAMAAQGIAFRAQNQLLALLAPMYRDTVTVK